jgi:hypothetical protein
MLQENNISILEDEIDDEEEKGDEKKEMYIQMCAICEGQSTEKSVREEKKNTCYSY